MKKLIAWSLILIAAAGIHSSQDDVRLVRVEVLPGKAQSSELELVKSFPTAADEKEGIYLSQAQSISTDLRGHIYVTDNKTCEVFIFDVEGRFINKIGRAGQGPGEFGRPVRISAGRERIAVLDGGNGRIQYIDENGNSKHSIQIATTYFDFAIGRDGTIYGTTLRRFNGPPIDALNERGEKRNSFGQIPSVIENGGAPHSAWLSISPQGELFAAYWFAPYVQLYSREGSLKSSFDIQYKPMQDRLSRNPTRRQPTSGGARVIGQSIIEAVYAQNNSFFILFRDLGGRIEILEFSNSGFFIKKYWTMQSTDYFPAGMIVRHVDINKLFYVLQVMPENQIDVFQGK